VEFKAQLAILGPDETSQLADKNMHPTNIIGIDLVSLSLGLDDAN